MCNLLLHLSITERQPWMGERVREEEDYFKLIVFYDYCFAKKERGRDNTMGFFSFRSLSTRRDFFI